MCRCLGVRGRERETEIHLNSVHCVRVHKSRAIHHVRVHGAGSVPLSSPDHVNEVDDQMTFKQH